LHEPLPPITTRRPDLPAEVDLVLQKATNKYPKARYQNAIELWEALQAAISGTPAAIAEPTRLAEPKQEQPLNPYKGLLAFQESDVGNFYGREAFVARLLKRFAPQPNIPAEQNGKPGEGRFLAVVGPSGGGKSSIVKAGLIPAVREGRIPGSEKWFIIEMLPGNHPLEELEAALLRVAVNPPPSLLAQLREDTRGLVRAVKRVLPGGKETELLLVIDQFEEIFTLVEDKKEAQFFLDSLITAVSDPRGRVRVVITLRADFYDRPLLISEFSQLMQAGTEVVVPLTAEELVSAIQEPATRMGVHFEEGLVPRIVAEVTEQTGALPLLQYSLTELFEHREGNLLTKAGYDQIGGVLGALSRRAEKVYLGLDSGDQAVTRQIFLRLVTLGEGVEDTRRRTLRSELEALEDLPGPQNPNQFEAQWVVKQGSIARVLEAFGKARLLSFDRDPTTRGPTVEVAHEALLREWQRLRGWLDESREDLHLQRLLGQMARDWEHADKDPSFLLRGSRLELIENWHKETQIALTSVERAYLNTSLADREARRQEEADRQAHQATLERRSRNFLRALIVVLALATGISLYLTGFAFRERDSARQAALAEAAALRDANSRELVRFAEAELQNPTDLTYSLELLLASQAVRTTWEEDLPVLGEAELALRNAINSAPILDYELAGHTDRALYADWSPDGRQIVASGADGTALVWDAQSGSQTLTLNGHTGDINTAVWSPDGSRILTASQDKTIRIWDSASGGLLQEIPIGDFVASAMWSPDGTRLLVAAGGSVRILDAQSGETLFQVQGKTGDFNFAAWSPSGDRFATADSVNILQVWGAATGRPVGEALEVNRGPVKSVQWSHDGRYLLSAHFGNLARIWDLQGEERPVDLEHDSPVQFASWDPEDQKVATATADGHITIWDSHTGAKIRAWHPHQQIIRSVIWSPDGSRILTADGDGHTRIWQAKTLKEQNSLLHAGPVSSVDWRPDGSQVLTAGGLAFSANIWDVEAGSRVQRLSYPGSVNAVAWSPDGSQFAVASVGTIFLQDASSGEQIKTLTGHTGDVTALAWSASGRYLASGGQDRSVRIWDVVSGETIQTLSGLSGAVRSVGWSPDESRLVTADREYTVTIWNVQDGQEILRLIGHSDLVNSAVYSPDGETILTASSDHTARLWDANDGSMQPVLDHRDPVRSAIWSPDGSLVATAGDDGIVILWNAQTAGQIGEIINHAEPVWSLAWSPDGTQIASASQDKTVQISPVGIEELLRLAESLIQRQPPEFNQEERCLYLHNCSN
ncbi:MAG: eIF2A-related protein, partial [Anaerolineales bacterium]